MEIVVDNTTDSTDRKRKSVEQKEKKETGKENLLMRKKREKVNDTVKVLMKKTIHTVIQRDILQEGTQAVVTINIKNI